MEASALTHAGRRGLLPRRSPLLRLQKDEQLVTLIRSGHDRAFEVLFDRYNGRLLAFCRSMLKSQQDAEDVLQEVFVAAHKAMLGDERRINVRPWIYRIARNRCLNHLRKPVAEGQDTMDYHPHEHGATTDDCVQQREELRQVISDVKTLPETQQTALLLREIDALSYEEIAQAMDTTIPGVKSLLVRARIRLAESSEARLLTCDDVRLELAEAAEGLSKASGPVRQHVRGCDGCGDFRSQLRSDRKALAAIFPLGPIALLQAGLLAKLGIGGGAGSGAASGAGGGALGSGALGSGAISGGAVGGGAAAGGTAGLSGMGALGAIGGAIGGKAAVGVATAALLTAGAVEVGDRVGGPPTPGPAPIVAPSVSPTPADIELRQGENRTASTQKAEKSEKAEADVGDEGALTGAGTDTPLAADESLGELTGGTTAGDISEEKVKAGESSGDDHYLPTAVLGAPPIIIVGTGEGESSGGSGEGSAGSGGGGLGSGGGDPPEDPIEEEPDDGEPSEEDDPGEPELPLAPSFQPPITAPATGGVLAGPAPASAAPAVHV